MLGRVLQETARHGLLMQWEAGQQRRPTCVCKCADSPLKGQVGVAEDVRKANVSCTEQEPLQGSVMLHNLM